MAEGQGQQAPTPPRCPVSRQMQQGHGVAAAGQGQGDGAGHALPAEGHDLAGLGELGPVDAQPRLRRIAGPDRDQPQPPRRRDLSD